MGEQDGVGRVALVGDLIAQRGDQIGSDGLVVCGVRGFDSAGEVPGRGYGKSGVHRDPACELAQFGDGGQKAASESFVVAGCAEEVDGGGEFPFDEAVEVFPADEVVEPAQVRDPAFNLVQEAVTDPPSDLHCDDLRRFGNQPFVGQAGGVGRVHGQAVVCAEEFGEFGGSLRRPGVVVVQQRDRVRPVRVAVLGQSRCRSGGGLRRQRSWSGVGDDHFPRSRGETQQSARYP